MKMSLQDQIDKQEIGTDVWENNSSALVDNKTSFFRLSTVDAENRTCVIKTFGPDPTTSDGHYEDVQWLTPYSNYQGDEIGFVPRPNSYGLCVFVGSMPWIVGFYNPITRDPDDIIVDAEGDGVEAKGGGAAANKEKINTGDMILRTQGLNRLVMRSGGEIEIQATKLCSRVYFPAQNRIADTCQNFEFNANGGTIEWVQTNDAGDTRYTQTFRDDVNQSNIVVIRAGKTEPSSSVIHRMVIGTPTTISVTPVYDKKISNDGSQTLVVNSTAFTKSIAATGEFNMAINENAFKCNIKPTGSMSITLTSQWEMAVQETGETDLKIGGSLFTLNIKPTGETTLKVSPTIEIALKPSGEANIIAGSSKITISSEGKVDVVAPAQCTVTSPTINLSAAEVNLGKSTADFVPMGKLLLAALLQITSAYNTHTHIVPQAPSGAIPSGPPLTPMKTVGEDVLSKTVRTQG